ncbi:hypothetical protein [Candidatus Nanoperiomorbus periodonticus]|uniref:hypothetical protein n=1 Tax=Candidatus Nanoperiomorbus periodonticus TaxID=2171989 RepID=UPI00101E0521|nr:hypothetical protein [Candidatus Nanoperiomorbus periodonticus]RYC76405.1 hypothetical protein G51EAM_00190 [Candidatus Nanoperiomorbus periodonticus]
MPDKRKLYLIAAVAMVVIMVIIIVATVLGGSKRDQANTGSGGTNTIRGTKITGTGGSTSSNSSNSSRSGSHSGSSSTSGNRSSNSNEITPEDYPVKKLDQIAQNLPREEILNIQRQIGYTLRLNKVSGDHGDIVIRKNSYRQTMTNADKLIYQTDFIIDLPKVKQSYQVKDSYSPLPAETSGLYDYTTLILCLDKSQLIYGDFSCNDRIKSEQRGY